ncbi:MAG: VWA domain-containing protein [Polyangiaceae bacterium]|nr:VWA domain-containing protein [Polyangiaceae bacterium]
MKRPEIEALSRWRLILGASADEALGGSARLSPDALAMDAALAWLYDRDPELAERDIRDRRGDLSPSQLTVPAWLSEVHRLFPKETIERVERDAVERYEIHEIVTNPDVLARAEPNETLLKAVLRTKHLMNAEVLAMARELVAKVVRDLITRLARDIRANFTGAKSRRRSALKAARNFDAKGTIRQNLATFDHDRNKIIIKRPLFFSRTRRFFEKWQIILLVDESGSMLGSVIHAAVTAACLWGLPGMRTHLCIFDTAVVDLTDSVTDPVEVLMRVQLGGGTDIGGAVAYAASLIEAPRRSIVVLITDFFEGATKDVLVRRVKALCDQGTVVIGLAALDTEANPDFDRDLARRLASAGAHIGAMTPGELAAFIAEKVR